MKRIFLTSGDIYGVGLEVTLKSLIKLGPQKDIQFVLLRSGLFSHQKHLFKVLLKKFKVHSLKVSYLNSHIFHTPSLLSENLIDIHTPRLPTHWVAEAAKQCLKKPKDCALVTGPLSKSQMQSEGYSERGHTGLLKTLSLRSHVFMAFLGQCFNVVLLTDHIPLKKIPLVHKNFMICIKLCLSGFKNNFFSFPGSVQKTLTHSSKKLACLGINPHAGENGLLGSEESVISLWVRSLGKNNIDGPLVPDTAFLKAFWPKYFAYLSLYHDQGLIPFKMIHERKSLQISLGLPFIRTSVSHGCAKDIFGQNKAQAHSMTLAISKAKELLFSEF